ncbi:MAG: TonB family protein [Desulfovibrio sp.]|jgi:TonB family protein|nr:TonB family protein [Desulfovibrio sp.]
MKKHALTLCLVLSAATAMSFPRPGPCASLAAADTDGGYSGKILEKLYTVWAPPDLRGEFQVRIKLALDGTGKLTECSVVKSSGVEPLDTSACGAARQIGKFPPPPYAEPSEVHISFWTGVPRGNTKERPDPVKALKTEIMERDRTAREKDKKDADAVEDKARQMAEQAAKRTGKSVPEAREHPVDPADPRPLGPPKGPRPKQTKTDPELLKKADRPVILVVDTPKSATPLKPAATPQRADSAGSADAPGDEKPAAPSKPDLSPKLAEPPKPVVVPEHETKKSPGEMKTAEGILSGDAGGGAPDGADQPPEKYLRKIRWKILTSILIPQETAPGEYVVVLRLHIKNDGVVENYEIVKTTGDALLDKYVLRGVKRAGNLAPPPRALGNPVEITLKLRRR